MKGLPIVALAAGALCLLAGAALAAHASPVAAASHLISGSLGSARQISSTLRETTPLLISGVAVFIALKAGLFNIGVEGQFSMGAITSAVVALRFPNFFGTLLALLFGCLSGAVWALPAGLIKAYRGGHEVITTIMLNSVAGYLTAYLVKGPFRDPAQEGTTTATIADASRIPMMLHRGDLDISLALLIGIGCLVLTWFWLDRTVSGYELKATGANSTAAQLAGIRTQPVTVWAMTLSGAIGGLAGAVQVLAYEGRFYEGFSSGFGFDALGVAILAGASIVAVIPAAFAFGILNKGSASLQLMSIPKGISFVVLGLLMIVFASMRYRKAGERETS